MSKAGRRAQGRQTKDPRAGERLLGGLGWGAVIFVAGAVLLVFVIGNALISAAAKPSDTAVQPVAGAERVDVVYFHRTERCASCQWAGDTTQKTVEANFQAELASGRVTFREIDVQKPENSALTRQYRAAGSSLFLNYVKDGRDHIIEASDTYTDIGNEARFASLLVAKIKAGLGAAS